MYKPSDDTFLLAECIEGIKGDKALDLCTGSGYIAYILSKNFKQVVATDINFDALLNARGDGISFICCNSCSCLNTKFDLITVNPPYLPSDRIEDITIDGGKEGIEITLKIIDGCIDLMHKSSKMFVVSSSLANIDKLLKVGLEAEIVEMKRIGFEDIVVIKYTM
jgi:release factor glutamine methyltransferase